MIFGTTKSLVYSFFFQPLKIKDVHADDGAIIDCNSNALEKLTFETSWATISEESFQHICQDITQDPNAVIQNTYQSFQMDGVAIELRIEESSLIIFRE